MLSGGVQASLALVAINAVLPAIDAALAHSPGDSLLVKQLLGAVGLAMVVGAPLGGFLVDRVGLRALLIGGGLLYTAAGTAGLYLSSLPLLVASRLAIGVTAGALQVVSMTVINTHLAGAQRAKWMGMHISVAMLGTLALHPISGFLGNFGWRWPFTLYFLGLTMVPLGLMQASQSPMTHSVRPSAEIQLAPVERGLLAAFPYHYLPFAMAIGAIIFVPTVYLPFILRNMGFGTPLLISLVLTADSVAGTITAMFYGRARRHISTHGSFVISFALTTIGLGVALSFHQAWIFIGGVMIYGIGVGWLLANLIVALSDKVSQAQQGRAAGFVKAAHFASAPLGIVLIEPIVRQHGPLTALVIAAILSACLLGLVGLRSALKPLPA